MFIMMNAARYAVGVQGIAIAERAYQKAVSFSRDRIQSRPVDGSIKASAAIIHHPDVRRMLLSMKAQVEAMRAVAYTASAALDKSKHHPDDMERRRNQALVDFLIPIVKGWCTEQCVEIASTGVQVHGGMGFVEETGAAQYLRDARITTIYEGTTGIQAADLVGRKVGYEKGATAFAVIDEMRKLGAELARSAHADVGAARASLDQAIEALAGATQWVVDTFPKNPNAVAAVSVPFLKLWGTVAGGWQMARAALIAEARLGLGGGDADFYRGKIATARFYAEHILSQAPGLASLVTNGADSVLAHSESQF
jgi:hypothetical protein